MFVSFPYASTTFQTHNFYILGTLVCGLKGLDVGKKANDAVSAGWYGSVRHCGVLPSALLVRRVLPWLHARSH
jgi:hypothetical protein